MAEDKSFAEKFQKLAPVMVAVVEPIKTDLKKHHLKKDIAFVRAHFSTTNVAKIPLSEMVEVYQRELPNGSNELGELVSQLWMLKHTDIYQQFEKILSREVSDFTKVEELPEELSARLVAEGIEAFGVIPTYVFCLLNDVLLPPKLFDQLEQTAEKAELQNEQELQQEAEERELDALRQQHQRELRRLHDKYEKKLAGMQSKYWTDVQRLQREVQQLKERVKERAAAK